jgi:hypothetical protein
MGHRTGGVDSENSIERPNGRAEFERVEQRNTAIELRGDPRIARRREVDGAELLWRVAVLLGMSNGYGEWEQRRGDRSGRRAFHDRAGRGSSTEPTIFTGVKAAQCRFASVLDEAQPGRAYGQNRRWDEVGHAVAEIVVRNWGVLIFLMGAMLLYGAFSGGRT